MKGDNEIIWMEFNWHKIKQDEKFMQEGASWKQLPTREYWLIHRNEDEQGRNNSVASMVPPTAEGKRIGETWGELRWCEEQLNCVRTKMFVRSTGPLRGHQEVQ
jgi:hypothetical protein